jgi:hypothetical protein
MALMEGSVDSWEVLMIDMALAEIHRPAFPCGRDSVGQRERLVAGRDRMEGSCSSLRT